MDSTKQFKEIIIIFISQIEDINFYVIMIVPVGKTESRSLYFVN